MKQSGSRRIAPSQTERKLKSAIKPIGQTRRTFLRNSTQAGVACVLLGQAEEAVAQAPSPSGTTGTGTAGQWYPMSKSDSKDISVTYDDLLTALMGQLGVPPANQALFGAQLRALYGWPAAGGFAVPPTAISQTVRWDEFGNNPDSRLRTPTKFKNIRWEYGGNPVQNLQGGNSVTDPAVINGAGPAWVLDLGGEGSFVATDAATAAAAPVGPGLPAPVTDWVHAGNTQGVNPDTWGNVARCDPEGPNYNRRRNVRANVYANPQSITPVSPSKEYIAWVFYHSARSSCQYYLPWPPPGAPTRFPFIPPQQLLSPTYPWVNHILINVSRADGGPTVLAITNGRPL